MPNNKFKKVFTSSDKIATGFIVEAPHISQSYDAFNFAASQVAYDIDIGGDLITAGEVKHTGLATGGDAEFVTVSSTGVLASVAAATSGTDGAAGTSGTSGENGADGSDGANGTGWADAANLGHGGGPTTQTNGSSGIVIIRYPT